MNAFKRRTATANFWAGVIQAHYFIQGIDRNLMVALINFIGLPEPDKVNLPFLEKRLKEDLLRYPTHPLPFMKGLITSNGGTEMINGVFHVYFRGPRPLCFYLQKHFGQGSVRRSTWRAKGDEARLRAQQVYQSTKHDY